MEQEEMINSFRAMIEELQAAQKELSDKLDGILNEAATSKRNFDKSQFVERNKDFFDKYRDDVKFIEGDDFDFDEVAFSGVPEGMEEAEYIAKLGDKISSQLKDYVKHFKDKYGEDVEVEAKTTETGNDPETTEAEVSVKPKEDAAETEEEQADPKNETAEAEDDAAKVVEAEADDTEDFDAEALRKKLETLYR